MRNALGNLVLALFGVVLALVVGEVAARFAWVETVPQSKPPLPPGLREVRGRRAIMQPNIRVIHRGVVFETNSFGFRDREYSPEPPAGVFRIVVTGDSFTMGQAVPVEYCYADQLEARLSRETGHPPVEVLNVGLSGLNIHGVFDRLKAVGLPFHPNLIVYGLTLNDIDGPHYQRSTGRLAFVRQDRRYGRFRDSPSRLLRLLWPRWQSFRDRADPPPRSYLAELLANYDPKTPAWRDFEAGLDRFAKLQQSRGVPVVVFVHTWLFYLDYFHPFRAIYGQIEAAAEQRGLQVIQSFPRFRGIDPPSLWAGAHDFHPNRRGHAILADTLFDGLQGLLPATPSGGG